MRLCWTPWPMKGHYAGGGCDIRGDVAGDSFAVAVVDVVEVDCGLEKRGGSTLQPIQNDSDRSETAAVGAADFVLV